MSFNSYFFVLIFLPIAVIGYHILNKRNHFTLGKWFLLCMSLWFSAYASIPGTLTCICLILFNFVVYKYLYKQVNRKMYMILAVCVNILSLLVLKYDSVLYSRNILISENAHNAISLIVPLGISFVTFSQISFLVDTYREYDEENTYAFIDYALYVLFFPKVTVGPIALSKEFIGQLNESLRKQLNWDNMAKGLYAFVFGLSKKVLLADNLSKIVYFGFGHCYDFGTLNALITVIAYSLQIYFDFSGFCDMAQGISLMLNIDVPVNFNSPYRAASIGEFWDRWHITLTKFFTKYVYIPLGGNRKGKIRTYINILIIFFISGIWHGCNITFVIWGLIHGFIMVVERASKNVYMKVPKIIRWIITAVIINISWIFFRAANISEAMLMIKNLFSMNFKAIDPTMLVTSLPAEMEIVQWYMMKIGVNTYYSGLAIIVVLVVFSAFASIFMKNTNERISDFKPSSKNVAIAVILLVLSIMSLSSVSTFIYVNF